MTDKIKKGTDGEELAASFLMNKGYKILARNYRYKHSEIDLVASHDNWLIFVEVKTRSSDHFGFPEEFVDKKKAEKIFEGAEHFIHDNEWQGNVRYDIISVRMRKNIPEIMHFEDAFY